MKKLILLLLICTACSSAYELSEQGNQAIKERRLDDALKIYLRLAKKEPDNAEVWWTLSDIYGALNQADKGFAASEKATQLAPSHVKYLIQYARFANWIGEYQIAKKTYLKVLQLEPNNDYARKALAEMKGWVSPLSDTTGVPEAGLQAESKNHWEQALSIYRLALQKNPRDGMLWLRIAEIESNRGNWAGALYAQERGAEIDPKNPEIFEHLAKLYLINLQPEKGVRAIEHAISLAPYNAEYIRTYRVYQGLVEMPLPLLKSLQSFHWQEAIRQYQEYLKVHPENYLAWVGLANVQSRLGRFPEAIASFIQAAKIRPDKSQLHYYLSQLYRLTGQKNEAWKEIQLSVKLEPLDIDLWQSYLVIAQDNGLEEEVQTALQRILALNPQFKE